jgi:hypothetical protein
LKLIHGVYELLMLLWRKLLNADIQEVCDLRHPEPIRLFGPTGRAKKCVDAKYALSANHTASRKA